MVLRCFDSWERGRGWGGGGGGLGSGFQNWAKVEHSVLLGRQMFATYYVGSCVII